MAEVVDGLTWTRSKPDLRMYREMFGMSTAEFGRLAAVDGRTVRAWENPREWVPDRTAWMAVESLWRDAERMASGLVPEAGADPVVLPYGTGASTPACVASRIAAGRLAAAGRPWGASFPRPDGVYGQINVYSVTTKSERYERSYWTRTAAGNGIGGRKAPVPYGS